MKQHSLVVIGVGIKFMSHLTVEAKSCLQQATKVLYLLNEPAMQQWIQQTNPNSESLEHIYVKHTLRINSYREISKYILEQLELYENVCVALYGHPTVFAMPALDAVRQAKIAGMKTYILPGISADACLFADLHIDPGEYGCQSFDATDFLIRKRVFDIHSHLILWQIGSIGRLTHSKKTNKSALKILRDYLISYYDNNHEIIIYEAAQYPHMNPSIYKMTLINLNAKMISKITTLYIPPVKQNTLDHNMIELLDLNEIDLE